MAPSQETPSRPEGAVDRRSIDAKAAALSAQVALVGEAGAGALAKPPGKSGASPTCASQAATTTAAASACSAHDRVGSWRVPTTVPSACRSRTTNASPSRASSTTCPSSAVPGGGSSSLSRLSTAAGEGQSSSPRTSGMSTSAASSQVTPGAYSHRETLGQLINGPALAGDSEVRLRVAALLLGRDTMMRAFSWDPAKAP
jgi:hypothetical protein